MINNGETNGTNQNQKTVLRKRMEELEIEIYQSWLKDLDKVKELMEITTMLEKIYDKTSIEEFFENHSDFDYFCKKFSSEIINNILKQPFVFGTNGDEVALNVLFSYLRIFYKFMEKSQYQNLWESMREIFDSNKQYYKGSVFANNKNFNEKKILSAEKYNEMRLPRKNETKLEITEGMEVDVLIDHKRQAGHQFEKRVWVRGKVQRTESDYFVVYVSEDPYPIFIKYNSFEFSPAGTMTKDWSWRKDLQQFDNIDCFDRSRWFPATILFRKEEELNGLPRVEYRIGFRVYPEMLKEWEKYKKYWPHKELNRDAHSRIYLGDVENLDEWIPSYSKRIQKFNTLIYNEVKQDSFDSENYFIDDMVKFDHNGKKTYIIGRTNGFYYYFAIMLNFFCEMGGFEKMIKSLSQIEESRPSPDLIHNIFYVLNVSSGLLHKEFVIELGKNLYDNIINYLHEMTQNEVRNFKKDTFELITKVLRFYLGLSVGTDTRNKIIEQFSITFAIKMMKTNFLEKRITAVKTIIDVIKSTKDEFEKRQDVLKLIEDNQVFHEIYGPNSHIQLINKSKELLEIMLQEDKLSDGEMELIWGATKKGDLEGKLTILRILKEISKSLQPKHIKVLLGNIYSSKGNELINDEIDLIYELSTHVSQNEETLEECIKFFTSCLLENKNDEGERIEILISKIFEITKINPSFKTSVLNMTIESLEKNENVNLALKILTKYLREPNLESDYDLNRLLIENDSLVKLFCNNFLKYIHLVKEKSKNWNHDIDLLPLRDNFNHSQNIKARLNFLNTLLNLKLWKIDSDPIEFVYKAIIEEGSISDKDKNEFFNWIKKSIDANVDFETEQKIFKLFNQKLCIDTKSCQHLSIEAFDTYLRVFLDINSQSNNLRYAKIPRENNFELDVYVEPESLIGFSILWKIVFESFSVDIMNKGIETLHSIFTNVQIRSDMDIDSSPSNQSYSQLLLKKCINLIKETQENKELNSEEKRNVITKCLFILKLMIEESEKRGTAGIKSHSAILKRKIINLKVSSNIGYLFNRDFSLRVYGNTTVWEIKELINEKLSYCFDFLKIILSKNNYELKNTDNGKTLLDLNIEDGDEIKCSSNGLEKLIPQSDIQVNGFPTDEVHAVFDNWYKTYTSGELMSKEDCAKFIKAVTNTRDEISSDDHRIAFLFSNYDKNKDDFLEKDEFTLFYLECTSKPDKRKVVWENLKTMGIRNDLKKISDPYYSYNEDKTTLPRYQLSNHEDFFYTIFYLQDLSEDIAKEAFDFLCLICTNPSVYKQILFAGRDINWESLLNESNIYKLIYSLQIIESFLEDIEINSSNVDLNSASLILENTQEVDINEIKKNWMKNFVELGGYTHLLNILQKKLLFQVDMLNKNEPIPNSLMNNICIEFLLKIVRIFYFSCLNKFDNYKEITTVLSKQLSGMSFNSDNEGETSQKKSSVQLDTESLNHYLNNVGLSQFIANSLDYHSLISNFLDLSSSLISKINRSKEEVYIINTSFEFLTVIIVYAPDTLVAENKIVSNKHFANVCLYGLINESLEIRVIFSNSLIKLCKTLQYCNRFELLVYLFLHIFDLIENISNELEKNSNEVFEFFSYLLEIYLNDPTKFNIIGENSEQKSQIDPQRFLKKMLDNLNADINEDAGNNKKVILSNELFIGYLKIVTKVAESNNDIKRDISENYNLIQGILTKVLFKQCSAELIDKLSVLEFINPDTIYDSKSKRNSNQLIRNACYNFIQTILKNSIENFEKFFSVNVLDSNEDKKESANERNVTKLFSYSNLGRNEGFVGIKNLGCICYMNAMMQQFFMVPSLRYSLLRVNDGIESNKVNQYNIDDNSLHQVQKLFSFLELTDRMDYNPFGFCYSFKDWDGNPTNTSIQQDSQEFLSRFLDIIENQIKPTPFKYAFQSIFGGKTCSQLLCEKGCGVATNRYEDFYTLSVEVNNMKTLYDSLEKLISAEKIDDFNCETCKRKVTITKRNTLASLPNVLIIHLQRLFYNYELDRNEKINSRLEFPKVLNLKDFCLEEITRRNAAKKAKDGEDEEKIENIETDDIYFRHSSYYEYHLAGVVVHTGSADAGHYYSFINTVRGGNENESHFNPKDESHINSWLEYNDSYISKFNVSKLEDECYGGSYDNDKEKIDNTWGNFNKGEKCKSAYMLVYERRIKSSIKLIVEKAENINNLITFKEDEASRVKKEYDLMRYIDKPNLKEIKEKVFSSTFYDVAKNEYFCYIPYYLKERLIPKNNYLEIMEDNSLFQKHQNTSDDRFVSFFDNIINILDETMGNMEEIKLETSIKISITFMNFIFNILSQKDKQQLLSTAKDKFLNIINNHPVCLPSVWLYINNNLKQLREIILNENENVVTNNCILLYELINKCYLTSPGDFLSTLKETGYEENMFSYAKKTIEFLIYLFPRIPTKLISKVGPILRLFRNLSLLNEEMYEFFANKEIIFAFVTFMLGKESPCYGETLIKPNENWDFGRNNISGFEPIVDLIFEVFLRSKENRLLEDIENATCVLSYRDLKCLKSPNFLKFIFKNCDKVFSGLLHHLNYEDEEFTIQSCVEITKYIDEIYVFNGQDFVKLFFAILPLLNLKDSLQRTRFEIIIGIPQLTIEEASGKNPFPLVGYHNLGDERSKLIEFKGTINMRNMCCVIKKMFLLKLKESYSAQIFVAMLEACIDNHPLLKYLKRMPGEDLVFENFIEWGVTLVNVYRTNDPYNLIENMKKHVVKINPLIDSVVNDTGMLQGFRRFVGNYIVRDIKKEEITLIAQKENLYVFQIEYFGNTITTGGHIDFSNSKSYVSGDINLLEDEEKKKEEIETELKIVADENIKDVNDDEQLIYSETKFNLSEREFMKKIIANFTSYKKVIVENKYSVPNTTSLFKRFIVFNNSSRDANVEFKISRPSTPIYEDINEYVPNSYISLFISSQLIRNIYIMPKINPNKDWCDGGVLGFNFEAEWIKNASTYGMGGNNYSGITNTPTTEYMNYTQYANYGRFGAAASAYNAQSFGNGANDEEGKTRLTGIDDDDDDDSYGRT